MGLIQDVASFANPISSVLGGIFGTVGTAMQNKTNLQIARETNQLNRQMFDDQLAFSEKMWNQQNAYNDPSAQRDRLEAAGLNPLFYGLDGTGNASGWTSASPVPAQAAYMQNPMQGIANGLAGISDAGLKASQSRNLNEQSLTEILTRTGKVKLQDVEISYKGSLKNLTDTEKENIIKNWEVVQTQLQQVSRQLDLTERSIDIEDFNSKIQAAVAGSTIELNKKMGLHLEKQDWEIAQRVAIDIAQLALNARSVAVDERNASTNEANARTYLYDVDNHRIIGEKQVDLMGQQINLMLVEGEDHRATIKLKDSQISLNSSQKAANWTNTAKNILMGAAALLLIL